MKKEFKIRKAIQDDVDVLLKIGQQVPEFHVSKLADFWEKEDLCAWIDSQDDLILIAEENDQIIGFCFFAVHLATAKATLENVWVKEAHRQQGVADSLFQEAWKFLREREINYVALLVKQNNFSAKQCFEKEGFSKGETVVWMDRMI